MFIGRLLENLEDREHEVLSQLSLTRKEAYDEGMHKSGTTTARSLKESSVAGSSTATEEGAPPAAGRDIDTAKLESDLKLVQVALAQFKSQGDAFFLAEEFLLSENAGLARVLDSACIDEEDEQVGRHCATIKKRIDDWASCLSCFLQLILLKPFCRWTRRNSRNVKWPAWAASCSINF